MPKPYPQEFSDDVVAVAREGQAPLNQIARDSGTTSRGFDMGGCLQDAGRDSRRSVRRRLAPRDVRSPHHRSIILERLAALSSHLDRHLAGWPCGHLPEDWDGVHTSLTSSRCWLPHAAEALIILPPIR